MLLNMFSIGNVGKAFSGFYKTYFDKLNEAYGFMKEAAKSKRQDSGTKQPAEAAEEQTEKKETENPISKIQVLVMQRFTIEMGRLFIRFVLAIPDILFGNYFTYPINCGWGLNRTRAIDFFNDKFNVKQGTGGPTTNQDAIKSVQVSSTKLQKDNFKISMVTHPL